MCQKHEIVAPQLRLPGSADGGFAEYAAVLDDADKNSGKRLHNKLIYSKI